MRECLLKYNADVFDEFIEVFDWLPIATLIDGKVFVVHGGLCRDGATLADMEAVPRQLFRPAAKEGDDAAGSEIELQLATMRDMLWADPCPRLGTHENKRGAGCLFGPDVCAAWLKANDLQLVIRSHECVPNGYDWPFADKDGDDERKLAAGGSALVGDEASEAKRAGLSAVESGHTCLTIFSASNYCGQANNQGAYAVLPAADPTNPTCHMYLASGAESDVAVHNMALLINEIVKLKEVLRAAFVAADPTGGGWVTLPKWCEVMPQVLGLNLQWLTLQPMLCTLTDEHHVVYADFLDRYDVEYKETGSGDEEAVQAQNRKILNQLYPHRQQLESIFRSFDTDGNGTLSYDEFKTGCELLNEHMPEGKEAFHNPEQLWALLNINDQVGNLASERVVFLFPMRSPPNSPNIHPLCRRARLCSCGCRTRSTSTSSSKASASRRSSASRARRSSAGAACARSWTR